MAPKVTTATTDPEDDAGHVSSLEAAVDAIGSLGSPTGFVSDLFGRVPSEDLAPYAPAALADLASAALGHLAEARIVARPKVRLYDVTADRNGRRRELTVLEAINGDRPFLLDTTLAQLVERGLEPHLVAHPILGVERDSDGALRRVVGETTAETLGDTVVRESLIHVHLDRIDDQSARSELVEAMVGAFDDVVRAADDRDVMRARLAEGITALRDGAQPLPRTEVDEATAFLEWLLDGNFVLLGLCERSEAARDEPRPGLGVLRDPSVLVLRRGGSVVAMTPEVRAFLDRPEALVVTKASIKSRVLRRTHLDYVGVKIFSPSAALKGELRLVGLFTPSAYASRAGEVPYLRLKVDAVVRRAGLDRASYAGRSLLHVMETYPRDELFQIDGDTLYRFALAIMNLSERPRVRVLARADEFGRFVSLLVYTPKDRTDAHVIRRIGAWLAERLGGRPSATYPDWPDGLLARTHYVVGTNAETPPSIEAQVLERGVSALVATWEDGLRAALAEAFDGVRARTYASRYAEGFSAAYHEAYAPAEAVADVGVIERLSVERPRAVRLRRPQGEPRTRTNLKVFSRGTALSLSSRVPLLEHLGFRVVSELTYRVLPTGGGEAAEVWLHDMALERTTCDELDLERLASLLEAAILAILRGIAESDVYNRLVLDAALGWRDVSLVRALGRYLQQLRGPYPQEYMAAALCRRADLAVKVVELFYERLDPRRTDGRAEAERATLDAIEAGLARVESLDDDLILRRFVNLVRSVVRTNFFQLGPSGLPRETLALKFDCRRIEAMPLPRPLFEVFVHSPRVEGVHLRFGRVARGGLRWSDRPQDYRTEVLGLVKAQQVKNAVIVPVGAKGGFLPKRLPPPSDRAAWSREGLESYRLFVRTLLELTDNIVGDAIHPPPNTVRLDGDDPYLVVAADKGTATFSDAANAISSEVGHWLGDAFASGGSQGYDHKGMGITAKGAWEAVRRHFREVDLDPERDPLTVVGVGDMSGDVFGNGMLLSRTMRLVAAFDHRDVFLDPDPDVGTAFAERERLFRLPRSSWADYDASLISPGGGVFSRSAKTVPLSPEVRARLGLDMAEATPAEVLRAILTAPVDLLWFGGIGTYVKASAEVDEAVGDRTNDAVRVAGADVRARVIGEGANLGLTQLGRIEAARRGVRLNTDAIDNSAGVNTSDLEVNIKVALSPLEGAGLLGPAARNSLLASMTDEVGRLVLRNNYVQTLSLSLAERRGAADLGFLSRMMQAMEADGRLDRGVEFLPDDVALARWVERGEGLTRPELAVLCAYAKLTLYDALLDGEVPDDPYVSLELGRYFPAHLRERFPEAVAGHRLRREIVSTQLANAVINRGGPAIVARISEETGADAPTVVAAYVIVRDAYDLDGYDDLIDSLDGTIEGGVQLSLYADVQDALTDRVAWFVRNVDLSGDLGVVAARHRDGVVAITRVLPDLVTASGRARMEAHAAELGRNGVPPALRSRMASLRALSGAPGIVQVAHEIGLPPAVVATPHFALADYLQIDVLVAAARAVPVDDAYDHMAVERSIATIDATHRRLTAEFVRDDSHGGLTVERWGERRGKALARSRQAIFAMVGSGLTLSKVIVAASMLGDATAPF